MLHKVAVHYQFSVYFVVTLDTLGDKVLDKALPKVFYDMLYNVYCT